jgi:hypothetical protein
LSPFSFLFFFWTGWPREGREGKKRLFYFGRKTECFYCTPSCSSYWLRGEETEKGDFFSFFCCKLKQRRKTALERVSFLFKKKMSYCYSKKKMGCWNLEYPELLLLI